MARKVSIDELRDAISTELLVYSTAMNEEIKAITKDTMKSLVKETKKTAPVGKRKKHYKSNIKWRVLYQNNKKLIGQWYVNGSDYRLSHLLENGHALRNGGRYEGTGFIGKATDKIVDEYVQKIEEVLRNG